MARPMARMVITPPQGQPMQPDHPNWTWHEYGMRVGFWRLKKLFDRLKITPTIAINARVCETYPPVIRACVDAGWELNAHGYDQVPMHTLDDQKASIEKTIAIIEKFWGKRPRGWFGPGLTQTFDTLDYLSQAGIEYIGDWVLDDEPVTLKTTHKPVVALPYNFELHDIVLMALQHQTSDKMYRRVDRPFRRGLRESPPSARRSWRSRCTPICPACRTASAMSRSCSRKSCPGPASPAGTASRFWTGISPRKNSQIDALADQHNHLLSPRMAKQPTKALPRALPLLTGLTAGVFAAFAVEVQLTAMGMPVTTAWAQLTSGAPLRFTSASVLWALAGTAFVVGAATAGLLVRFPPPWRNFRRCAGSSGRPSRSGLPMWPTAPARRTTLPPVPPLSATWRRSALPR